MVPARGGGFEADAGIITGVLEGAVIYLPIYMCYLLREQKLGQMIVDLDMAGL